MPKQRVQTISGAPTSSEQGPLQTVYDAWLEVRQHGDSRLYEHEGEAAFRGNKLCIGYWDIHGERRFYQGVAMPGNVFVVRDQRSGEVMTLFKVDESTLEGSWALDAARGDIQIQLLQKLRRA